MWGRMRGKGCQPCRFSIFYCGCKPLKSIHKRHFDCKVTKKRVQDKKNLVFFSCRVKVSSPSKGWQSYDIYL